MRIPTMTTQEAASLLGAPPIDVTSANRGIVRKWLVARGPFLSAFVGGLSLTELAIAYNEGDSGVAKIRRKYDSWKEDNPDEAAALEAASTASNTAPHYPAPLGEPALPHIPVNPYPAGMVPQGAELIEAIKTIAESVVPKAQGVDRAQVIEIIRAELPALMPVQRIDMVDTSGAVVTSTGTKPVHKTLGKLIKALQTGLHVLLVGPAGSGKTTGAEMAFEALQKPFNIEGVISGEHKITGYCDAHGRYITTASRDAFQFGKGLIKDEIDGDDPNGCLAFNAMTANGYGSFPDSPTPVKMGEGFQVVACANTILQGPDRVYVGRNQLDAATIDRFVFIDWEYDESLELAMVSNHAWVKRVQALRAAAVASGERIVISPRASIFGAKLLAAGWSQDDVESSVIWKGTNADTRRRIEQRA